MTAAANPIGRVGSAYLDTAVDAMLALVARHEAERGEPLRAAHVERVHVRAGLLTVGMEAMSGWYRAPGGRVREFNMNFSVAYSLALVLLGGRLTAAELDPGWWEPCAAEIEEVVARVELIHGGELDRAMAERRGGLDLGDALGRGKTEPVLDGVSFADYELAFPAVVEVHLADGTVWEARQDVPLGGAGRPEDETRALVQAKLEGNGAPAGAFDALEDLASLGSAGHVRALLAG